MAMLHDAEALSKMLNFAAKRGRRHNLVGPGFLEALWDPTAPGVKEIADGETSGYYFRYGGREKWALIAIGPCGWKCGASPDEFFMGLPKRGEPNPDNWVTRNLMYEPKTPEESTDVRIGDYVFFVQKDGIWAAKVEGFATCGIWVRTGPDAEAFVYFSTEGVQPRVIRDRQAACAELFRRGKVWFKTEHEFKRLVGYWHYRLQAGPAIRKPPEEPFQVGDYVAGHLKGTAKGSLVLGQIEAADESGRPILVCLGFCTGSADWSDSKSWKRVDGDPKKLAAEFAKGLTYPNGFAFMRAMRALKGRAKKAKTAPGPLREKNVRKQTFARAKAEGFTDSEAGEIAALAIEEFRKRKAIQQGNGGT
jgi:hypothetical protein